MWSAAEEYTVLDGTFVKVQVSDAPDRIYVFHPISSDRIRCI